MDEKVGHRDSRKAKRGETRSMVSDVALAPSSLHTALRRVCFRTRALSATRENDVVHLRLPGPPRGVEPARGPVPR
jgi:hypothetical protein